MATFSLSSDIVNSASESLAEILNNKALSGLIVGAIRLAVAIGVSVLVACVHWTWRVSVLKYAVP